MLVRIYDPLASPLLAMFNRMVPEMPALIRMPHIVTQYPMVLTQVFFSEFSDGFFGRVFDLPCHADRHIGGYIVGKLRIDFDQQSIEGFG